MATLDVSWYSLPTEISKNNTKVIWQQGEMLTDWEWNTSQDLQYERIRQLYQHFIGDGILGNSYLLVASSVNQDNNFKITGNSFTDKPAFAFKNGYISRLNNDVDYIDQIYAVGKVDVLNSNKITCYDIDYVSGELVNYRILMTSGNSINVEFNIIQNTKNVLTIDSLSGVVEGDSYIILMPILSPPTSGSRTDLVYLDIFPRIINSIVDPEIIHPALNYEVCQRERIFGFVKVAEGSETLPTQLTGHNYLVLGNLIRDENVNGLTAGSFLDLRNLMTVNLSSVDNAINNSYIIDKQQGNKGVLQYEQNGLLVTKTANPFEYRINTGFANYDGKSVHLELPYLVEVSPPMVIRTGDFDNFIDYEVKIAPITDGVIVLDHKNIVNQSVFFHITDINDIELDPLTDYSILTNGRVYISPAFQNVELRIYYEWSSNRTDYICIDYEANIVVLQGLNDDLFTLPDNSEGLIVLAQVTINALATDSSSPIDKRNFMHCFRWGAKQLQLHKDAIVLDPNYEGALTANSIYTSLLDGSLTIDQALNYIMSYILVVSREFYGVAGDTVFTTNSLDYVDIIRAKEFYRQIPTVKDGFIRRYKLKVQFEDNIPSIHAYNWIFLSIRKSSDDTIIKEFYWNTNNLQNRDLWISGYFELPDIPVALSDDRDLKFSIMCNDLNKSLSGTIANEIKIYQIILETYDLMFDATSFLLYNEGLYNQGLYN